LHYKILINLIYKQHGKIEEVDDVENQQMNMLVMESLKNRKPIDIVKEWFLWTTGKIFEVVIFWVFIVGGGFLYTLYVSLWMHEKDPRFIAFDWFKNEEGEMVYGPIKDPTSMNVELDAYGKERLVGGTPARWKPEFFVQVMVLKHIRQISQFVTLKDRK
jgi:hypothetical protein